MPLLLRLNDALLGRWRAACIADDGRGSDATCDGRDGDDGGGVGGGDRNWNRGFLSDGDCSAGGGLGGGSVRPSASVAFANSSMRIPLCSIVRSIGAEAE